MEPKNETLYLEYKKVQIGIKEKYYHREKIISPGDSAKTPVSISNTDTIFGEEENKLPRIAKEAGIKKEYKNAIPASIGHAILLVIDLSNTLR